MPRNNIDDCGAGKFELNWKDEKSITKEQIDEQFCSD